MHPCVPVPEAEQRLLLVAYHLALADLRGHAPLSEWGDLLASAELALRLLTPSKHTPEAIDAAQGAQRALHRYAEGIGEIGAAVAASGVFLGVFEEMLRITTWRRLIEAEADLAAAWSRAADLREMTPAAG